MISTAPQVNIRLSDDLKARLRMEARKNARSVNAEIASRLEASFAPPPRPVLIVNENTAEADIIWELYGWMKNIQSEIGEVKTTLKNLADVAEVPDFVTLGALDKIKENLSLVLKRVNALTPSPEKRLPSKDD